MSIIGKINELTITKEVPFGVYLQSEEGEILLPKKYVPQDAKIGDKISVFVYTDSEDRIIATTLRPKAQEGEFALMAVKSVTKIGAFLDWGLEKDLFVPLAEQKFLMKEGQKYVVRVCLDHRTDRLIGSSRINTFLDKEKVQFSENQEVEIVVYGVSELGFSCIVNGLYDGLLYKNEVFEPIQIGEKRVGYVKQVRPDGKIDLLTRQQGFSGVKDLTSKIMDKLTEYSGFMPYNDATNPEIIYEEFGMSKKTFKKLLGNLLRERKISIEADGVRLLKKEKK